MTKETKPKHRSRGPAKTGGASRLSDPAREFDNWAKKVRSKWASKKKNFRDDRFAEAPDDWFRRATYVHLKRMVKAGDAGIFDEVIQDYGRRTAGKIELRDQPFKKGLLAMFADGSGPARETRRIWGDRFEYAYRNCVSSKYLAGFIRQSGPDTLIAKKLKRNHVEPGFKARKPASS